MVEITKRDDEGWDGSEATRYEFIRPRRNIWTTLIIPALIMLFFVLFANLYFFDNAKQLEESQTIAAAAAKHEVADSSYKAQPDFKSQIAWLSSLYLHLAEALAPFKGSTVREKFDFLFADYTSAQMLLRTNNKLDQAAPDPVTNGVEKLLNSCAGSGAAQGQAQSGPTPVYFAINSKGLTPPARQSIARAVEKWRSDPTKRIKVEGFADTFSGTPRFNKALADARAVEVYSSLAALVGPEHVVPPPPKHVGDDTKPKYETFNLEDREYSRVVLIWSE